MAGEKVWMVFRFIVMVKGLSETLGKSSPAGPETVTASAWEMISRFSVLLQVIVVALPLEDMVYFNLSTGVESKAMAALCPPSMFETSFTSAMKSTPRG